MPGVARTRYAADTEGMVCLLLDIRGQARQNSLQVFSYSKGRVVSLPRRRRDGRELIRIETPDATRWAAVSVPRWLANSEGLYGKPDLPPVMSGFCRLHAPDNRTVDMVREDAERDIAELIVSQLNKYRRLPGQRMSSHKADRLNANLFA
jgi:hypothetical protein